MSISRQTARMARRRRPRRPEEAAAQEGAAAAHAALRAPAHQTSAGERQAAALELQRGLGNRAVQRRLLQRDDPPAGADSDTAVASGERPTLRVGSRGPAVRELQERLNALGARPRLVPDGAFGPLTRQAVISIQERRGLTPSGVADAETWAAMDELMASPGDLPHPGVGAESPQEEVITAASRASAAYDAGDYATAYELYQGVYTLRQVPELRVEALWNMARCQQLLGNTEEAVRLFQGFLLNPVGEEMRDRALEMLRRLRAGEEAPTDIGELTPPSDEQRAEANTQAEAALDAGDRAMADGDPATAEAQYRAAYGLGAAGTELRGQAALKLAAALHEQEEYAAAIDLYQEALAFPVNEPRRAEALEAIRMCREAESGEDVEFLSREEADAKMAEANAAFVGGRYEDAGELYGQIYAQGHLELSRRQRALGSAAFCAQRLQEFDTAIRLYEEFLLFPGVPEEERDKILEKIRQCRNQEIGMGVRADEATEENQGALFGGPVSFETGGAALDSFGADTLDALANLLEEHHNAEPALRFRIELAAGASSRWRGAGSEEQADELNMELSRRRAAAVDAELRARLPAELLSSGVYSIEQNPIGDEIAEEMGLDPDDNTWRLRSVLLSVSSEV